MLSPHHVTRIPLPTHFLFLIQLRRYPIYVITTSRHTDTTFNPKEIHLRPPNPLLRQRLCYHHYNSNKSFLVIVLYALMLSHLGYLPPITTPKYITSYYLQVPVTSLKIYTSPLPCSTLHFLMNPLMQVYSLTPKPTGNQQNTFTPFSYSCHSTPSSGFNSYSFI